MDTKDISGDAKYFAFFNQIKQNAERASLRKGEKPRHFPPSSLVVAQFMMNLFHTASMRADGTGHMLTTSQIPPHYPPSVRPIQGLKPLVISRMTLENHHRGYQVLIHVLTPPDRINAITAIVEDEEGTAVLLQLYSQPDETIVKKENVLKAGDVCIIKEPFFKVTTAGTYSLRVDHVSDIIWLQDTDYRIPLDWRKRILSLDESSKEIRLQGNAAVGKQNWGEAESLYTNAIRTAETSEEKQLAHLNRSLVNLHLGRLEKALDDARRGGGSDNPPSEKALFREARALYSLGKFSPCLEKFSALVRSYPNNSDARAEIQRVKQRILEEETGSYQFDSMYKQAKATPPLIDCATYAVPVAVRDSAGRGKGLFTTKPVKAGELLLCEKAFGYSYAGDDSPIGRSNMIILMNLNSKSMCMGGQANLITQVVQKIYHNHAGSGVFTDLHHGDYNAVTTSKVDRNPVVDTFLVTKIIGLNCFGAPRTSYNSIKALWDGLRSEREKEREAYTTCGVWPLASRINHSCVPNCRRSFLGDMLIVRACEDMEAGTELRFPYQYPDPDETYEQVQKKFGNWGFACDCALCLDRKRTPRSTVRERKTLQQSLKQVLKPTASAAQVTRAAKILETLEKTYAATQDAATPPLPPRGELWDPYFALGKLLLDRNKPAEGLEMLLKSLETLGFIVVARPPRDIAGGDEEKKKKKDENKKAVLEIKHWGYVHDYTMEIFLQILRAYGRLAPELCEVVKEYAGVAYSICVGEKETIGKRYPDFLQGKGN
ncbi:hypothetical protein Hte_010813 [Hypoxylon texense]